MTIQLNSCNAQRPDRRNITKMFEEVADGMDNSLARELTDVLLAGSPVEIEVSFNTSSAFRALRKLDIEYEILD